MILRKFIGLTIFALFTLATTHGQSTQDAKHSLYKIKKVFQEINNYENYYTLIIEDPEEFLGHGTDNGGNLTGYFKGDSF